MMRRAGDSARGFTLLEVLVALVIVAFGMGAVLAALSGAAANVGALREKTLAQWVALNRVADARLNLQGPQTGTTEGDVKGFGNGNWHWKQIITSMQEVPGLLQITVSVRRNPATTTGSGSSASSTSSTSSKHTSDTEAAPWITTVIGFRGDALAASSGEVPGDWSGTDLGTSTNANTNNGTTTGTVPNPGTNSSSATPATPLTPTPPTVPVSPGGSSSGGL
ncbi:MAG TPA: type II secretion system minor pseudopilin GspI [Steroidobacteraceae bacterium]